MINGNGDVILEYNVFVGVSVKVFVNNFKYFPAQSISKINLREYVNNLLKKEAYNIIALLNSLSLHYLHRLQNRTITYHRQTDDALSIGWSNDIFMQFSGKVLIYNLKLIIELREYRHRNIICVVPTALQFSVTSLKTASVECVILNLNYL